jgi:hypothetical protein
MFKGTRSISWGPSRDIRNISLGRDHFVTDSVVSAISALLAIGEPIAPNSAGEHIGPFLFGQPCSPLNVGSQLNHGVPSIFIFDNLL